MLFKKTLNSCLHGMVLPLKKKVTFISFLPVMTLIDLRSLSTLFAFGWFPKNKREICRALDFLKILVYPSGCNIHPILHSGTFSILGFLLESAVFINLMVKLKDSLIPLIPSHCACGFNDFTTNFMLLEGTTDHNKSDSCYCKPGKRACSCSVGDTFQQSILSQHSKRFSYSHILSSSGQIIRMMNTRHRTACKMAVTSRACGAAGSGRAFGRVQVISGCLWHKASSGSL